MVSWQALHWGLQIPNCCIWEEAGWEDGGGKEFLHVLHFPSIMKTKLVLVRDQFQRGRKGFHRHHHCYQISTPFPFSTCELGCGISQPGTDREKWKKPTNQPECSKIKRNSPPTPVISSIFVFCEIIWKPKTFYLQDFPYKCMQIKLTFKNSMGEWGRNKKGYFLFLVISFSVSKNWNSRVCFCVWKKIPLEWSGEAVGFFSFPDPFPS